ncbi:hypothetical protein B7486_08975 [cyanobacterium TDX16]|nr:hypothetical protein B7486_08975 [cyanobacterium TDX16]
MSNPDSMSFDACKVPRDQRIKLANSILGKNDAPEVLEAYEKALKAYRSIFSLPRGEEDEELISHLGRYDEALGMVCELDAGQSDILSRWLKANKTTLDTLLKATSSDRVVFLFDENAARLSDATSPIAMKSFAMAKLIMAKANERAMQSDWDSAFEWNRRAQTIGRQLLRHPLMFFQQVGFSLETRALRQLLIFACRCPSVRHREILNDLTGRDRVDSSNQDTDKVESLHSIEMIESVYEWLDGKDKLGKTGEMLATMVEPQMNNAPGIANRKPFKDVDELRLALRESSVKGAWANYERQCRLFQKWRSHPFHVRWKTRDEFSSAYWRIVESEPCMAILHSWIEPTNFDYCEAAAIAQRHATICVFAILDSMDRLGRLPKALSEVEQFVSRECLTDPFSGETLRYKVDANVDGFTLYSVGEDQIDDDGLDVGFERGMRGDFVYWPVRRAEIPPMDDRANDNE